MSQTLRFTSSLVSGNARLDSLEPPEVTIPSCVMRPCVVMMLFNVLVRGEKTLLLSAASCSLHLVVALCFETWFKCHDEKKIRDIQSVRAKVYNVERVLRLCLMSWNLLLLDRCVGVEKASLIIKLIETFPVLFKYVASTSGGSNREPIFCTLYVHRFFSRTFNYRVLLFRNHL